MSSIKTTERDETEFKRCECGCGTIVNPKRRFLPGHDQRYKGVLLCKFDGGDAAAAAELIERGWRSEAELVERRAAAEKREQVKQERVANRKEKAVFTKTATEETIEPAAKSKRDRSVKTQGAQLVQPVA